MSARSGCFGPCPVWFWVSPRMETPQHFWLSCSRAYHPHSEMHFFIFPLLSWCLTAIPCISVCLLLFSLTLPLGTTDTGSVFSSPCAEHSLLLGDKSHFSQIPLYVRCSNPIIIFLAHCWSCFMFLLNCGAKNRNRAPDLFHWGWVEGKHYLP